MNVVVERSRKKMMWAILGCLALVLASAVIATQGPPLAIVIGVVGLVTFLGFGVTWVVLSRRKGPGLVVDDEGFDDRSSAVAVGRVPWSDVRGLSEWTASGSSSVVVHVADPDVYLVRLPWLARRLARVNVAMAGSPVTIASTGLDIDHERLFALLQEGLERHRRVESGR